MLLRPVWKQRTPRRKDREENRRENRSENRKGGEDHAVAWERREGPHWCHPRNISRVRPDNSCPIAPR
jgi:hypothetical protein